MNTSPDSLAALGTELAPEQLESAAGGIVPMLILAASYGVDLVVSLID